TSHWHKLTRAREKAPFSSKAPALLVSVRNGAQAQHRKDRIGALAGRKEEDGDAQLTFVRPFRHGPSERHEVDGHFCAEVTEASSAVQIGDRGRPCCPEDHAAPSRSIVEFPDPDMDTEVERHLYEQVRRAFVLKLPLLILYLGAWLSQDGRQSSW